MAVRLILTQSDQKLAVDVRDGTYIIGRDERAEVVVPNATVSGRHAELRVAGEVCTIRDLGSSNGTFVNGVRITGMQHVAPGDDVALGSAKLVIAPVGGRGAPEPESTAQFRRGLQRGDVEEASTPAPERQRRIGWMTRLWLAGAIAIFTLVLLLLLTEFYAQRQATRAQLAGRYMALASQYMHALRQSPSGPMPAPVFDQWIAEPVLVLNAEGRVVHPSPQPGEQPRPSPLLDSKTGAIPDRAKTGMNRVTIPASDGPIRAYSYPVTYGGELFGFVIARPGVTPSNFPLLTLIILCAAIIALLILYVALRPITVGIRSDIELLREKLTPLSHGIIDSLPRGNRIPELDDLAAEVEQLAQTRNKAQSRADQARHGADQAYTAHFPMLLDTALLPYCFISSDFHLLSANRPLTSLQEFATTRRGVSIFESGMTNVQSKQLIRAINDARTNGEGRATVGFVSAGESRIYDIVVKKFTDPESGNHVFGLLFNPQSA